MMISFDVGESQKFNLRAACLIIRENRILFQRFVKDDYWFLPGGRIEMMEESMRTVEREVQEEYGWKVQGAKLVWIVENFFQLDNRDFHELCFYYYVQLEDELAITDQDFSCLEGISVSRWIPIDELHQYNIVPALIKDNVNLAQIINTQEVKHMISRGPFG